ncbi:MAG: fused MFS/spermidine synthase [Thermoflexales bacterium]|nr:fused MFS/spermidine synthase [Thermoflexales bacterium]
MNSSRAYLYFTVFVSGCVTLAVEMSASRLIEPFFGTSNLVWAVIIGLILLYLSAGYVIGGRWADRSPRSSTLYAIIAWGAFTIGLVPFAARPVLQWAVGGMSTYDVGLLGGSFTAVLILLSVPVTLLGCVSPFAIRLAMRDLDHAGNTAGLVYAVSTAGSFLGTFLPVLILIPNLGTRATFLLLSLALMGVALAGLGPGRLRYGWMPALLLLLSWWLRGQPIKAIDGALFETESSYNYIQVAEYDGVRYLYLNEGQGIHSVYNPHHLRTYGTWDYFALAPYFNPPPSARAPERVAIVGLAAGTIARQLSEIYGPIAIDGIEIDPRIVQVGRDWFDMNQPNLNVIVGDGRYALAHSDQRYSVIGVDAYRLPYIPWHLTTREFFLLAREHLSEDGVIVINVGHTDDDWRMVEAMVATLSTVFPSVHTANLPDTFNAIVFATQQPTTPDNLRLNAGAMPHTFLREVAGEALENLYPVAASGVVFTDDKAPVEQMTNAIVLGYIMSVVR